MSEKLEATVEVLRRVLEGAAEGLKATGGDGPDYGISGRDPVTFRGVKQPTGMPFASMARRKSSVVMYFFPIYTHPERFEDISPKLRKCLKGKSCFHFKAPDPELMAEVGEMLAAGKALYDEEGIV